MGNGTKVPSFIYKIVIDPKRNAAIAFVFPNIKLDPKEIENYVVPISDIEKYTGINFSPMIPANLKLLETTKGNYKDW